MVSLSGSGCSYFAKHIPQGCTSSTQRSPAGSPRTSQDAPNSARTPVTANAPSSSTRSRAPLRLPRAFRCGPDIPNTRSALERERQIFFETRVTGRPEIWQAVQLAVNVIREQHDLNTAQGILDAAGVTVPRGRLEEGVWDQQGQLYGLENWVISDPIDVIEDEDGDDEIDAKDGTASLAGDTKGAPLEGAVPVPTIAIKCRLSDRGTDIIIQSKRGQATKHVAELVREGGKLAPETKLKLAYLGRILKSNKSLEDQGWREGHVISALVSAQA